MSSADMGAQRVRPADVEDWLADLGLTPTERADRDGIASWDLVLDGRRRFDLRVTVILDPAMAIICWAQYAPPISDYFRKSYRRLLRWNDEFPFAKFSVSEDERPVLAVEVPIEAADADALGTRDRPDPRHRRHAARRVEGLAVARRPDARLRRPHLGQRGVHRAVRRPAPGAAGVVSRRFAALILAVVAATGLLASPAGSAEVRAAAPSLTIVTDADYDVQPDAHRVQVTLDMVMKNRLADTSTKRFYFDHAFLSVLPGASAPKLTWSGSGTPRASV